MVARLLPFALALACSKNESAKPLAEAKPLPSISAAPAPAVVETCNDGRLEPLAIGDTLAGAPSAPASVAAPSASASAAAAPVLGAGFGSVGFGPGGSIGGPLRASVRGTPLGEKSGARQAFAKGACSAVVEIRVCFQDALARGTPTGSMDVEITVEPDGKVSAARLVTANLKDEPFERCTMDAFRAAPFEAAAAGTFTYRLLLGREKPVRLKEAPSTVSGALPKEVIRRVVRSRFPRLRACYEAGRAKDPSLAGTVRVRFTIEPNGKVADAKLDGGTLTTGTVPGCVLGVFESMSFPEPEGGGRVVVTYPIDFAPE